MIAMTEIFRIITLGPCVFLPLASKPFVYKCDYVLVTGLGIERRVSFCRGRSTVALPTFSQYSSSLPSI